MANIRKTFKFREGVNVDDNVLVVAGQRVGIGTTVPAQVLDVRGRVTITGDIDYSNSTTTGVSTFAEVRLGTGVTISSLSGIVTAVSFSGDGSTLSNLPTSQWQDMDVGLGFTSIYNAGNVGVGTTDPRNTFQVGDNPDDVGRKGVGINSETGNIKSSGIITATTFSGALSGNASTSDYSVVSASSTIAGYATTSGISTTSQGLTGSPSISVTGIAGSTAVFTGVVTASSFSGALDGNADTATTATNAQGLTGTPNITVGIGSFNSIGIGTANPIGDIQIINSGISTIAIGNSSAIDGNNGVLVFGNTSASFPYSNANSLDIVNYGIGNVNFHLEAGTTGVSTGDFNWIRRKNYDHLMILTHAGRLGLGITLPANDLHVVGTSTVTGLAYFGNNVEVKGDLSVDGFSATGTISIPSLTASLTGNVNAQSGVSTFTKITTKAGTGSIGIGTDAPAGGGISINSGDSTVYINETGDVGINTTDIGFGGIEALQTAAIIGAVGVGTTTLGASPVDFYHAGRAGAGTTTNRFMLLPTVTTAERNLIDAIATPPLGVGQTALGALVFNSTTKKIQFFNGDAWETVTSA
tara:strand:- start:170 stop:1918 length:1749 start_codon:yes stop_codon:yes gene_type:complete